MSASRQKRGEKNDGEAARGRLALAEQALDDMLLLSPEQARALLDERARRLAAVPDSEKVAGEEIELVNFAISNERYAIEVRYVLEVIKFAGFTTVPGGMDWLVGVINLRGVILAVFDLRELFGVSQRAISDLFRVLVVGNERAEFGLLVDAAHEVSILPAGELLEPPPELTGRELLRGVTKDALAVLDGAALLNDVRLSVDHTNGRGR